MKISVMITRKNVNPSLTDKYLMRFGKIFKGIADGVKEASDMVKEASDDRKQKKRREKLTEIQDQQDYDAGQYCKVCQKIGDFENECTQCHKDSICDVCILENETWGKVCRPCSEGRLCYYPNCGSLSDEHCIGCKQIVCNKHKRIFFSEKGFFYECLSCNGLVCKQCSSEGRKGLFNKSYHCLTCGDELKQNPVLGNM